MRFNASRHHAGLDLALADHDLVACKVDVFHAQPQTFHQAHAGAIQQAGDQPGATVHGGQKAMHFVLREDHGQPLRAFGAHDVVQPREFDAQHLAVEKQQCRQRLILRARCNMPVYRKIRQKPLNLGRAHRAWMALAVAQDEAAYPCHIGLLSAQTVVFEPQTASNLGQQTRLLLHLTGARYTLGFACVSHYTHRFADMQLNLIAARCEHYRASG